MRLVASASGKTQPIARSGGMVVAKAQRPEPVVLDRMSVSVARQVIETPAVYVINSDLPTSGIANQ